MRTRPPRRHRLRCSATLAAASPAASPAWPQEAASPGIEKHNIGDSNRRCRCVQPMTSRAPAGGLPLRKTPHNLLGDLVAQSPQVADGTTTDERRAGGWRPQAGARDVSCADTGIKPQCLASFCYSVTFWFAWGVCHPWCSLRGHRCGRHPR